MGGTKHAERVAKLAKAKHLVQVGYSIVEAASQAGLTVGSTRWVAQRECWLAERQGAPPIDRGADGEMHQRKVFFLVRQGLERLEKDASIPLDKYASTLDLLDKVGRRLLGLDGSGGTGISVLRSNVVITPATPST